MPVINTNTSAQFAQDALKANAKVQTTAMQQLATGNRINAAKDDAAGLSIGQNMTSQIRGLNQAVRNVNDGINLLQTADGALVETSNMLQRMRELAVQSSNATNSASQRVYLNNEFSSLKNEITRISNDTTWNNARLFGAAETYSGPDVTLNQTLSDDAANALIGYKATYSVADAAWKATFTAESAAYDTKKTAADLAQSILTTALTDPTGDATSRAAALTAFNTKMTEFETAKAALTIKQNTPAALSAAAALEAAKKTPQAVALKAVYDTAAALSYAAGNRTADALGIPPTEFEFQAGIQKGQTIKIKLDVMDAGGLDIEDKSIDTFANAQNAISQLDLSIEKVNSARSGMGATMNQLSYSADNMINISTNIAASRSTIMDTDYATASAQLAKTQIISQAATAMLTQANQQPQSVLALLKG